MAHVAGWIRAMDPHKQILQIHPIVHQIISFDLVVSAFGEHRGTIAAFYESLHIRG